MLHLIVPGRNNLPAVSIAWARATTPGPRPRIRSEEITDCYKITMVNARIAAFALQPKLNSSVKKVLTSHLSGQIVDEKPFRALELCSGGGPC
jgi:hypothetical protein